MDHSSEPNIVKILVDFSEYERLKHIETQYIEQNQKTKKSSSKNNEENDFQSGGGSSVDPPEIIPPVATLEEPSKKTQALLPYDVQIDKSDENSLYDEKQLLALVPSSHLGNAKYLLSQFNKRGNEITWNSSGVIYSDKVAIPLSNIFLLFPLLFKRKKVNLAGFEDFVQKIYDMGLGDLILQKPKLKKNHSNTIFSSSESNIQGGSGTVTNVPWWYIGD